MVLLWSLATFAEKIMKSLFSIILSLAILSSYFSKTRAETIDIPIGIISAESKIFDTIDETVEYDEYSANASQLSLLENEYSFWFRILTY